MNAAAEVDVRPISGADIAAVANFLHANLNARVSAADWTRAMQPKWATGWPNHGYMLIKDGDVVGAYLAFYADRPLGDRVVQVCNLAAFCVREDQRAHGLRLLRALLRQREMHFTDLSPSGNVVELNRRLGFALLETATKLAVNVPWRQPKLRITCDPAHLERALSGTDRTIYRDHARSLAARHLLVRDDQDSECYVMYRRDRRKQLPLFASVLHLSNPALFARAERQIHSHLLIHHGIPFTLTDSRLVPDTTLLGHALRRGRPKMFKSRELTQSDVSYLYSELTEVAW